MTYVCVKGNNYNVFDVSNEIGSMARNKMYDTMFEVDSMIATPVALLNEKGYITEMSCAAHYHDRLEIDGFIFEEIPENCIYKEDDDDVFDCVYSSKTIPDRSFVRFQESFAFNELPNGWKLKDKVYLYHQYPDGISEFDFYEEQAAALKSLYKWIIELPTVKSEINSK